MRVCLAKKSAFINKCLKVYLLALGFCLFIFPSDSKALLQQISTTRGTVFIDADPLLEHSQDGPINLKTLATKLLEGKGLGYAKHTMPANEAMALYARQLSEPVDQSSKIIAIKESAIDGKLEVTFFSDFTPGRKRKRDEFAASDLYEWVFKSAELSKSFIEELAMRVDSISLERGNFNEKNPKIKPQSDAAIYLCTIDALESTPSVDHFNNEVMVVPDWLVHFLNNLGYDNPKHLPEAISMLKKNAYYSESFAIILAKLQLAQKSPSQSIKIIKELITNYGQLFLPKAKADAKQHYYEFIRDGQHADDLPIERHEQVETSKYVTNNKGESFLIKRSRITVKNKRADETNVSVFLVSKVLNFAGVEIFADGPRRLSELDAGSFRLGSSLLGTYVPADQQNTGLYTKVIELYSDQSLKIKQIGLESENRETLQLYSTIELLVRNANFRRSIGTLPRVQEYLLQKGITDEAIKTGDVATLNEMANLLSGLTLQARARSKVNLSFYPGRGYLGQFFSSFVSPDVSEITQRALKEIDAAFASAKSLEPLHPYRQSLPRSYRDFLARPKK